MIKNLKFIELFVRNKRNQILKKNKFKEQFEDFQKRNNSDKFSMKWEDRYPCYNESTLTLESDKHYIYHTAWAARKISEINPEHHVDISSFLYFAVIASAFIPIKYYEYRVSELNLNNLTSDFADLKSLPFDDNSIKSLSCMHTVEHIGLGRYGDEIDPEGDTKAINELKRVLAPGGDLLFVVPIGKPKIHFNAHRIYSYNHILEYFKDYKLVEFSLITDELLVNPPIDIIDSQIYGCGCFWFKKT